METKQIIGLLLLISGLALSAVSLWMLADPVQFMGITVGMTDAPKVGIAAGILAIVAGVACFMIDNKEKMKIIILLVIVALFVLSTSTLGVAIKERLDIDKAKDVLGVFFPNQQSGGVRNRYSSLAHEEFTKIFEKLKTQLIALIVVAVFAMILQVGASIVAFRIRPSNSPRNTMPMVTKP